MSSHDNQNHAGNHWQAAELHELAAHAHSAAAEDHGKQEHQSGQEHTRQALEHSSLAHLLSTQHSDPKTVNEHGIARFGHEQIAKMAHDLWLHRGSPEGSSEEDWFRAAALLRGHSIRPDGEPVKT